MRILIVGCNGQVGRCLTNKLENKATILAVDRNKLDITNNDLVRGVVAEFKPDYIINAAAHTAVDKAEDEIELSYEINAKGPKNLASAANENAAVLIHISTDYVFDGQNENEYTEDMPTNPQSVYGESKLAGEIAVTSNTDKYLILRTSWVFGEHGNNFVKTMLRLAQTRNELNIVSDQFGGPTYSGDIADAIIKMIVHIESGNVTEWGVYHFSGAPHISWDDFARIIFAKAYEHQRLACIPKVNSILTSAYPTRAKRPTNSRLNCHKIKQKFNIDCSDWQNALNNIKEYR
ncbi:dTDP-4-dehydrorhamnose reductase [Yersinia sp. 1252 StPb PI]|uniref:dTDP-4-dehydrorhamnose reductase n=1 Tax=Yersinia sp. 1252 StPb PI TaxID=3117404 RepID=UPI003B27FEC6